MKIFLLILMLHVALFAENLELESGYIKAHTEMVFDNTIDPINKSLMSEMSIQSSNIESMRGSFWVNMNMFISDMLDRDTHMYDAIESKKFILAKFTIDSVTKIEETDMYEVSGELDFHGIKKELHSIAKIIIKNHKLEFNATTTFNMDDFGIEMPCMMFMCVREQVDLIIEAKFSR